jgi:hypothetical protein
MQLPIVSTIALSLSLLVVQSPGASQVSVVDPGFESFKLATSSSFGWYSDDVANPSDPRFAGITMSPDSQFKTEGQYSLRIEQLRPRPNNWGRAYLCQRLRLPKNGGPRSFDLGVQMRGYLRSPVLIDVYVWERGDIARPIGRRDVHVSKQWSDTTVSFNVPSGYDRFGIWIYMPRDDEAVLWVDNVRLLAK